MPLESERGYHAMLPSPSIEPRYTTSYKSRGFALTPKQGGLRAAGSVEFAGLEAAPDERRAHILAGHARALFPGFEHGEPKVWMGHRPSTPDSLPVLGGVPGHPGLFLAFGHSHFGVTGGPADQADEVLEACCALWECWDTDALVLDRERGVFAAAEKIRYADFAGNTCGRRAVDHAAQPAGAPGVPAGRRLAARA